MEHSNTIDKIASWVVVNIATGEPLFETFSASIVGKINTKKYKAVPIDEWLASLSIGKNLTPN